MKKRLFFLLLLLMPLLGAPSPGACDSLYVDNREESLSDPERLNLREQPSTNSAIVALYYTGAQVENLGAANSAFTRVRIGGVTGYMVSRYLCTWEEAMARYGADSPFGQCRAARVDLTGMWREEQPVYEAMDASSAQVAALRTGDAVQLTGIVGDWAYVAVPEGARGERMGYVPLDALTEPGDGKVFVVAGAKTDGAVTLYDRPNDGGAEVMRVKNGAACIALFGRGEGNWRRVRVGGVSGWIKYTQASELAPIGEIPREAVPYYPQMVTASGGALLMSRAGSLSAPCLPLEPGARLEVLGERGEYAYVRTFEGGAGDWNCGAFGYVAREALTPDAESARSSVAQADDGDLPVLLLAGPYEEAPRIGALCAGAQVTVCGYTQTDYACVAMGEETGYVHKTKLRLLSGTGLPLSERIPQRAKVRAALTLRAAADETGAQIGRVGEGERVYMLGVLGDWAYVRYGEGPGLGEGSLSGFAPLAALNAPASTTHLTAFVNTDKVNMRDREDKTGEIVARARLGECLRVACYGVDWCCVVTPAGKRGYIMTEYLDFG